MPLDVAQLTLPAYEQAYVQELYDQLQPDAVQAYRNFFYQRTPHRWQAQMAAYVELTGEADDTLPAYQQAYVREAYVYLREDADEEYVAYIMNRTPYLWQADMATLIYVDSPVPLYEYMEAVFNDGGGLISAPRQTILQTFIETVKSSGPPGATCWDLAADYWPLWGENETQGLISLKQGRRCTPVAGPVFTASRGFVFNGTTQYLNSNFRPAFNGAGALTVDSMRLAVYARASVATNTVAVGAFVAAGQCMMLTPLNATNVGSRLNSSPASHAATPVSSLGYTSISRSRGEAFNRAYKNGSRMPDATISMGASLPPPIALFIGANNSNGTVATFRALSGGMVCAGGQLSDAQELAEYNAVQAMATSIGAQV